MTRDKAGLKDRLQRLAIAAGSQRKLAEIIGVSSPTVLGWAAGSWPYESTFDKIVEKTGVSLEWIRDGKGDSEREVGDFAARLTKQRMEAMETTISLAAAIHDFGHPSFPAASVAGARGALRNAREKAKITYKELGRKIGRDPGYLEALEKTGASLNEATAELLARELPVTKEELLAGSDSPPIEGEGVLGTYGAKSRIAMPPGKKGRNVPLLSHAEAGPVGANHSDALYDHISVFAPNLDDRRGFAIEVHGHSMEPRIKQGDYVICSPRAPLLNGEVAVVRTHSGPVYIKYYTQTGDTVILESENKTFKPLEFPLSDIAGAWAVVGRVESGKMKKEGFASTAAGKRKP